MWASADRRRPLCYIANTLAHAVTVNMLRILFALSEMAPYSKTGGLADVGSALPAAIAGLGVDIRVLVPAYRPFRGSGHLQWRARVTVPFTGETVELWSPEERPQVLFLRYPPYYERPGGPYQDPSGVDWPDNDQRFALLSRVAVEIAQGRVPALDWQPDIVHANDWQTGLIPYLLHLESRVGAPRPAVLFTIHNLAYQGRFDPGALQRLHLPPDGFHWQGTEFYGTFSFMKTALIHSDRLSTVSPTYAREIQEPELGMGLEGVLRARCRDLFGILNGIDTQSWNPGSDPYLPARFQRQDKGGKALCKAQLQMEMGLYPAPETFLLAMISRLVTQKGVDLVLDILPDLLRRGVQFVLLGSGEQPFEEAFRRLAAGQRGQMAVRIAFDEGLAHRIEAGADAFLMPSRFEPCGLNQMYSLRYGTLPIVRRTGGLADTVVDAEHFGGPPPNGFVFVPVDRDALLAAVLRAESHFRQPAAWRYLQDNAMALDFSWERAARAYLEIYQQMLQ